VIKRVREREREIVKERKRERASDKVITYKNVKNIFRRKRKLTSMRIGLWSEGLLKG
jgi:hypothetical protein